MATPDAGPVIRGLTGRVTDVSVAVEALESIAALAACPPHNDIDLQRMAAWAMNYLIRTPRQELNHEPVFQCDPTKCPPVPAGHDVVVPCDTDARMNWEWYYMREISGSEAGQEVERAFHQRLLDYVQEDGTVLAHVGCYNEGDIHREYRSEDYVYHVWGATKILYALAEDFRRTGNEQSRVLASKIMLRLKRLAVYPTPDICYFPAGMGAVQPDGTPVPNGWNKHPAPVVGALVNYYLATGDQEALAFARAYAEGMIVGAQPGGIRFANDGSFGDGHGHVTMHAVWGVAHLGLVTGESRYMDLAKRAWDWMLSLAPGTGWFPAAPMWAADIDETCLHSDMMSTAALIARAGYPEYWDYVERYQRNYISPLQFIVTPEFEERYRQLNPQASTEQIRQGLDDLHKFQGAIIAFSGLNDCENALLGRKYHGLAGCCAPEGMRAIYTTWSNVIGRLPQSKLGPAGVYVNLCFSRNSPWGRVVSFFPDAGRLTVQASVPDTFLLRPPHWAARDQVRAFRDAKPISLTWSGAYVRFDNVMPGDELTITYPLIRFTHEADGVWKQHIPDVKLTFEWLGNMVTGVDPAPQHTPLFLGRPRILPRLLCKRVS